MYSGSLKRAPFQPDSTAFQHAAQREEYIKSLRDPVPEPFPAPKEKLGEKKPESLARLLELVSPEDSALIALVVFLLCDNTENDVVLLGILLYVLLSK
ncbi:MAG: hypothetical protein IJC26_04935 [Clostridia bacterium]|nr:hypothetical protein [Clostridia bacterium]